jgi:hypothetical protein
MPLLAYFTVVGSLLVGLLYVAEAQFGPPTSLSVSTNFYGVPQPWKPESIAILTVREAPAPQIAKSEAAKTEAAKTTVGQSAEAASALAKAETSPVEAVPAPERKIRKTRKTAPQKAQRNLFAQGAPAGKNHGVVW